MTSLETGRPLANGRSWGGGGVAEEEVCILYSPGITVAPISLFFCGRSLWAELKAEKILFTGRQTFSLYLVL